MEDQVIPGDGVVTGYGRVDGRVVYVFAQDFTVFGGSLSETNAAKIVKVMDLAVRQGAPVVGLNDSGGARIQEGVMSLAGYADIFLRNTLASGVVPQISAIMGPCAGGAVYSPAITDFIVMVEGTSYMFVTGPDVIKTVTHEEVTKEELGGAMTHNATSGVAHFAVADDRECLLLIRELLGYLPSNNVDDPPRARDGRPVRPRGRGARHAGARVRQPAVRHARPASTLVVDDGHFLEVQQHYARNIVVGFARLGGRPSASSPTSRRTWPACLDIDAVGEGGAVRALLRCVQHPARHLRGRAGLPARAPQQEFGGIIRHGAKLLFAFAEATVPKITVITRKAYGGAYCVMVEQAHPHRHELRVADRRDRGHGARGRGQHPLQARDRRGRGPGRAAGARRWPSSATSSPTRSWRPAGDSSTK